MSAGAPGGRKELCSYFVRGACRYGDRCCNSHDLASSVQSTVCKYYLRGACAYGSSCRYDHVKPEGLHRAAAPTGVAASAASLAGSQRAGVPTRAVASAASLAGSQRAGLPAGAAASEASLAGSQRAAVPTGSAAYAAAPAASPVQPSSGKTEAVRKFTPLRKGKDYGTAAAVAAQAEELQQQPPSLGAADFHGSDHAGFLSYSDVVKQADHDARDQEKKLELCPLAETGHCFDPESCGYMHGLTCDMCNLDVLHPSDEAQQRAHHEACLAAHERSMERAFAAQRNAGKSCEICHEVVESKDNPSEQRFGILTTCKHVFCLSCIRSWRRTNNGVVSTEAIRGCPSCREISHFVIPSEFWVEDDDEKEKLIAEYKSSLKKKHCSHFARGSGECPFGTSCFYLHAYPDGTEAPAVFRPPRRRYNQDGELERVERVALWDFLTVRSRASSSSSAGETESAEESAADSSASPAAQSDNAKLL